MLFVLYAFSYDEDEPKNFKQKCNLLIISKNESMNYQRSMLECECDENVFYYVCIYQFTRVMKGKKLFGQKRRVESERKEEMCRMLE